ncbi:hypothetical protein [Bacillus sp. Marseille-Q1617]|uniref:hypothetical protein n=1 Tax=Bacillus sp. Marseille-Q1617 TaxID=2736887 RepID=UPI0015897A90|nr:hypothetical protein [Bacillus sp. Marseille-Q1617]
MDELLFRFQVKEVSDAGDEYNSRDVLVFCRIMDQNKDLLQEGLFRVRFNSVGIYPYPADIAKQVTSRKVQRLLLMELKRYIKPQRKFLKPGSYKPVW